MTDSSPSVIVLTITLFITSCPFYMCIGIGSIQYYAARSNASEEAIEVFFKTLSFPFTIYARGKNKGQTIHRIASINGGMAARIGSSLLPLISAVAILLESFPQNIHTSELFLRVLGFSVVSLPIAIMWKFGNKLGQSKPVM
ncbi:MAG: hypothetical protein ABI947_18565 [Chloroflexota bacterium]